MNNLTMPAILVATVMVAGAFAFIPVEQATTVHLTTGGSNNLKIASSFSAGTNIVFADTEALPTLDVHNQVTAGYIIVSTMIPDVDLTTPANLDCAAWSDAGVELGTPNPLLALAGEFTSGNQITYHCHIPDVAGTVLVGIAANGGGATIPAHTLISTTIDSVQ